EIGVRIALGAQRGGVLRFVLGGALRQVLVGMVIALPLCLLLSFALSRLLPTLTLFGFNAYVLTPAMLLGVALLAPLRPAWRATAISPMTALRGEWSWLAVAVRAWHCRLGPPARGCGRRSFRRTDEPPTECDGRLLDQPP